MRASKELRESIMNTLREYARNRFGFYIITNEPERIELPSDLTRDAINDALFPALKKFVRNWAKHNKEFVKQIHGGEEAITKELYNCSQVGRWGFDHVGLMTVTAVERKEFNKKLSDCLNTIENELPMKLPFIRKGEEFDEYMAALKKRVLNLQKHLQGKDVEDPADV